MPSVDRFVVWGCLGVLLFGVGACTGPQSAANRDETPRGYYVQVRMTEDKAEAERTLGRVLKWWAQSAPADLPRPLETTQGSPVDIAYRTPLYRVRLGPFGSRDEAEAVLAAAQETYPDAFVAPGRRPAPRPAP